MYFDNLVWLINANEVFIMLENKHEWAQFYSPRNGRISIQACQTCGVAKSMVMNKVKCLAVADEKRKSRLRGWSMNKPIQSVVAYQIS